MDFLKAGGMKKREDAAKNPVVGEVSLGEVRPGEKPPGEKDLQTPLTSDPLLEETALEFSFSCHFQFEASLLSSPVLPECRSAC